jgi:outer membrane lipoprotein-sorting protein
MIRTITIVILAGLSLSVCGQKDPDATPILDAFSYRATKAEFLKLEFNVTVNDKLEETSTETEGNVVISGNRYKLQLPEYIIWFNGEAIWTLQPEVEEVTITLPDPDDLTFLSSPSLIFNIYKEGYKYRLLEQTNDYSLIDLYPEDPSGTEFTMIKLKISSVHDLIQAEYRRKDGIDIIVEIKSTDSTGSRYKNSFFEFDSKIYPDVEVIDMR